MAEKSPSAPPKSDSSSAPVTTRTTPAYAAGAVSLQPAAKDQDPATREQAIRARAYFLWEQAGRPEGDGVEFWMRAEQELTTRE